MSAQCATVPHHELKIGTPSGGLAPPAHGRWAPAVSHLWGPLCL